MSYHYADFAGNRCGHHHRTFEAAERCAQTTLRAARAASEGRRSKFGHPADSDLLALWADNEPAMYVREDHL